MKDNKVVVLLNTPSSGLRPSSPSRGEGNSVRGFTLIELLVVVLIIGILAAVALPQYRLAVTKSRVQSIFPILSTLRNAEEAYYLANGTYSANFSELDVSVPCTFWEHDASVASCGKEWVVDLLTGTTSSGMVVVAHYCPDTDVSLSVGSCTSGTKRNLYITYKLAHSDQPNKILCNFTDSISQKVCNSLIK